MKRRGRVRRVAKWTGLLLCGLTVSEWVFTIWFGARLTYASPPFRYYSVQVVSGGVVVGYTEERHRPNDDPGWQWVFSPPSSEAWQWLPEFVPRLSVGTLPISWLWVPAGIPLATFAAPTAWLWWSDRRRVRACHCRACGYDLAGLGDGAPCPECGERR